MQVIINNSEVGWIFLRRWWKLISAGVESKAEQGKFSGQ